MSSMRFDPSGLVVACRRVVERHPECGPLWWLCAHLLTAQEPFQLAWELADEIDDDSTADALAAAIPDDAVVLTIGWTDICLARPDPPGRRDGSRGRQPAPRFVDDATPRTARCCV